MGSRLSAPPRGPLMRARTLPAHGFPRRSQGLPRAWGPGVEGREAGRAWLEYGRGQEGVVQAGGRDLNWNEGVAWAWSDARRGLEE